MKDYMMPKTCRKPKKVEIYYVPFCFVTGFKFFSFDQEHSYSSEFSQVPEAKLIFEIGTTNSEGI